MPIQIKCLNDDCNVYHTLRDDEYERKEDGRYVASMHNQRCPACRERFDRAIEEVRRVEQAQAAERERERLEYYKEQWKIELRERIEELVSDYNAPRAMIAAIESFVEKAIEESKRYASLDSD